MTVRLLVTDNKKPDHIDIHKSDDSYSLVSKKKFKAGEVVFKNNSIYVEKDTEIYMTVNHDVIKLNNIIHTVSRGNKREFFYFDTFCNHSCEPNCMMSYKLHDPSNEISYEMICVKDIHRGDEITCDYTTFDSGEDNTMFECNCNSINCKKYIYS